ncbi:hypothetical protein B0H13DRAFT_2365972 [Mycena leptocephala]|nr:hypothetical protein B0H13DRAFT_2365972 [Mycena leptocephala]
MGYEPGPSSAVDETHQLNDLLLKSDAELVRGHQAKVDAGVREINNTLDRGKVLAAQDSTDLRQRPAVVGKERVASLLYERVAFSSAPVHRVPDDVLVEIFIAVQSMAEMAMLSNSVEARLLLQEMPALLAVGHAPATVISQVCSRWRATASDLVSLYLERARSAPLTVEFVMRPSLWDKTNADRTIAALAASAPTLIHLRFACKTGDTGYFRPHYFHPDIFREASLSFRPLRSRLLRLETLQIPESLVITEAFEFLPSLHTLSICAWGRIYAAPTEPHPQPKFNLAQIRYLSYLTTSGIGMSILSFRNVTHLTSREIAPTWHNTPATLPTILPTTLTGLTHWTVEFEGLHYAGSTPVFSRFNTPSLLSLDIVNLQFPAELIGWMEGARFNLTTLVLRKCTVRISELLSILNNTPLVEVLTIVDGLPTIVTDRLLWYLTVHPELPEHHLTRLSSLTLSGVFAFGIVGLVDMLESRTAHKEANDDSVVCTMSSSHCRSMSSKWRCWIA